MVAPCEKKAEGARDMLEWKIVLAYALLSRMSRREPRECYQHSRGSLDLGHSITYYAWFVNDLLYSSGRSDPSAGSAGYWPGRA